MSKPYIVDYDFESNVVFTDEGRILQIESYVDEEDTPCLPEEACAIYVIVSGTRFQRFELEGDEEDDFDQNY